MATTPIDLLSRIIDELPLRLFWKDRELRYLGCNLAFARDAGLRQPGDIIGLTDADLPWRAQAARYSADDAQVIASEEPMLSYEEPQTAADGKQLWLRMTKVPLRDASARVIGVLSMYEAIRQERERNERLRLYLSIFESSREAILVTDATGSIVEVNPAFSRITGYARDEVLGRNPRLLSSGLQTAGFYESFWNAVRNLGHWHGEVWNRRKSGELYAESLHVTAVHNEQGELRRYVAMFSDITPAKEQHARIRQVAHYDELTELPNRSLLVHRLAQAMDWASEGNHRLAVIDLDLDDFARLNEAHGASLCDELLVATANALRLCLEPGETLARVGGDEFVAILLEVGGSHHLEARLESLLKASRVVLSDAGLTAESVASLGVTFFPQSTPVVGEQLLRQAEQALYQAKLAGRHRIHVFDTAREGTIRERHRGIADLMRALEEDEFRLFYQPKVCMRSGSVLGMEALLRWKNPERGLLPPAAFLPLIEQSNRLTPLFGRWVLATAALQVLAWRAAGLNLPVSVNISARHLQREDFIQDFHTLLTNHPELQPGDIDIEVVESTAIEDVHSVARVLEELAALGFTSSIDDFGTGYSSLTYLRSLPAGTLKIDQSFVRNMLRDPEDLSIVEGILGLARAFRRHTVAEGVETADHGCALLRLGCTRAQGYAIARPMPADEVPAWTASWRPLHTWVHVRPMKPDAVHVLVAHAAHLAWMDQTHAWIAQPSQAHPPAEHECRFGQWLRAEGRIRFGRDPAYAQINQLHDKVHAACHEILMNPFGEGHAVNATLERLENHSRRLLACLAELEDSAVEDDDALAKTAAR
jgi:diguanylate cyclase (GGDEF)-like protein/PAS domain S-box-containing protein